MILSTLKLSDRTVNECAVLEEKIIKMMEAKYSNAPIKKMLKENKVFLEKLNAIVEVVVCSSKVLTISKQMVELLVSM